MSVAPPAVGPPRAFTGPDAAADTSGGVPVVAARRATLPTVHVRVLVGVDPSPALTHVAAESLGDLRSDGRPLREVLRAIPAAAGTGWPPTALGQRVADPAPGGLVLHAVAPGGHLRETLQAVCGVVGGGEVPDGPVTTARSRVLATTRSLREQPRQAARRVVLRRLYGLGHPYAEPLPDDEAVAAVSASDVAAALAGGSIVAVALAGDLDPGEAVELGAEAVEGLPNPEEPPPVPEATAMPGWEVLDRPDAVQTTVRLVTPLPPRGDERRPAAEVLAHVLGGGAAGRLERRLREERGFGYHPGAEVVDHPDAAHLDVQVDVATEVTGPALDIVLAQLRELAEDGPDEEELDIARRSAIGALGLLLDQQSATAELLLAFARSRLAVTDLVTYSAALREVTASDVRELAGSAFSADQVTAVVSGDVVALRAQAVSAGDAVRAIIDEAQPPEEGTGASH